LSKLLQINTTANSCSHGRIAESIGSLIIEQGHESYIAYGRTAYNSNSTLMKIGSKTDNALHLIITRLLDRHGFGSFYATMSFIDEVIKINPDIIHLHNLHGYYLNIAVLFEYLKKCDKPVVWTFHDCWPFTGHCSHFEYVRCNKWRTGCFKCPNIHGYPKSWFIDNSKRNYYQKKELFTGIKNMILVSPSEWLAGHLRDSFLSECEIKVINNGIDTDKFKPIDYESFLIKYKLKKKYILGVASIWSDKKGLSDFMKLRGILEPEIDIVLVGLSKQQIKVLPLGIRGVMRTESINELAALYTGANMLVNPTYIDNFPSVNLEALACGTPVITYNTGGSPEAINRDTGIVIEKGNLKELHSSIIKIMTNNTQYTSTQCREQAVNSFSAKAKYKEYFELYIGILNKQL
jgi:putative colanic acid biosynthesis glycosyltransferase